MTRPQKPTVLIVEDEFWIRAVAAEAFSDAGFAVLEAEHAAQAISVHAADGPVQLLFTDVNMPGELNGIDLAERMVLAEPDLPIIFTSALPMPRPVDHLRSVFVTKPYVLSEVCSTARSLLAG